MVNNTIHSWTELLLLLTNSWQTPQIFSDKKLGQNAFSGVLFFPPSSSFVIRVDHTCHSHFSIPLHYWYQPHLEQTAQGLCVLNSSHYGPEPPVSGITNTHHTAFVPGEIRFLRPRCVLSGMQRTQDLCCSSFISEDQHDLKWIHLVIHKQSCLVYLWVKK